MRFRKNPVVVDAVQLTWKNWSAVCEFLGDIVSPKNPARYISAAEASDTCGEGPSYIAIDVPTIHGEMATVRHGDWIIAEPMPGRFYPCKPDIFAVTYEPVSDRQMPSVLTELEQDRARLEKDEDYFGGGNP